ncbi:MAG: acyltransferase, partial [Clostridia bacterium]
MIKLFNKGKTDTVLPSNLKTPGGHIDVLDGLRGLAILLVLWFHLWQLTWFNMKFDLPNWGFLGSMAGKPLSLDFISWTGFIGVELFFFVSGFCLFYPYAQSIWTGKRNQSLLEYTGKRFFKIVPSYLLALLVIGIMGVSGLYVFGDAGGLKGSFSDIWPNIWSHLTFTHNLNPATEGGFTGVLWSLAVEVQFYFIFPIFAWFIRKGPIPALLTFGGMIAIAFFYRGYYLQAGLNNGNNFFPLHQLPAFIDLFAYGMFAAWFLVLLKTKVLKIEALKFFFTVTAVLCMVGFFMLLNEGYLIRYQPNGITIWQVQNRLAFGVVLIILTIGSAFAFKFWRVILANKVLVFLSTISYNLYMWHQFIIRELVTRHIGYPQNLDLQKLTNPADEKWIWIFSLVAVVSSIAVATLITYLFELPILNFGKNWLRKISNKRDAKKGLMVAQTSPAIPLATLATPVEPATDADADADEATQAPTTDATP